MLLTIRIRRVAERGRSACVAGHARPPTMVHTCIAIRLDRVARPDRAQMLSERCLGVSLGAESLFLGLPTTTSRWVRAEVDAIPVAALTLENSPSGHRQTLASVHFSCTFDDLRQYFVID